MTTVQAQRVIDALKEIGLTHGHWRKGGDFTVRTDITRKRDRQTGIRYSEFGDAMASVQRTGYDAVLQNAQALADKGLHVILVYGSEYNKLVTVIVSSKYNPTHSVSVLRDGRWSIRPKEAVS